MAPLAQRGSATVSINNWVLIHRFAMSIMIPKKLWQRFYSTKYDPVIFALKKIVFGQEEHLISSQK